MQIQLMARGRSGYIQTRMEHILDTRNSPLAAGGDVVYTFQLEDGDEECQVKRLVLSQSVQGQVTLVKWGLFQEAPSAPGDFTNETLFAAATCRNQVLIDRTTTMRVPRGWHIGVYVQNLSADSSGPSGIQTCTFLHYKVLS